MKNNGEPLLTPESSPKEENEKLLLENEELKKDLEKEKFYHRNLYNQWKELNDSVIDKDRELEQLKSAKNPKLKFYQYAFYGLLSLIIILVAAEIPLPQVSAPSQEQSLRPNSANKIPDKNSTKSGQENENPVSIKPGTILTATKNPVKYLIKQKSYFYNKPDSNTQRKTFVLPSNDTYGILNALGDQNGFIYVVFTNHNGHISKGWIRKNDLEPIQ